MSYETESYLYSKEMPNQNNLNNQQVESSKKMTKNPDRMLH